MPLFFSIWFTVGVSVFEFIYAFKSTIIWYLSIINQIRSCTQKASTDILTLKVLNFWKFTIYCNLKPLWSGMGEVVPARTSPTLHPPSPPTVATSTLRVNTDCLRNLVHIINPMYVLVIPWWAAVIPRVVESRSSISHSLTKCLTAKNQLLISAAQSRHIIWLGCHSGNVHYRILRFKGARSDKGNTKRLMRWI